MDMDLSVYSSSPSPLPSTSSTGAREAGIHSNKRARVSYSSPSSRLPEDFNLSPPYLPSSPSRRSNDVIPTIDWTKKNSTTANIHSSSTKTGPENFKHLSFPARNAPKHWHHLSQQGAGVTFAARQPNSFTLASNPYIPAVLLDSTNQVNIMPHTHQKITIEDLHDTLDLLNKDLKRNEELCKESELAEYGAYSIATTAKKLDRVVERGRPNLAKYYNSIYAVGDIKKYQSEIKVWNKALDNRVLLEKRQIIYYEISEVEKRIRQATEAYQEKCKKRGA